MAVYRWIKMITLVWRPVLLALLIDMSCSGFSYAETSSGTAEPLAKTDSQVATSRINEIFSSRRIVTGGHPCLKILTGELISDELKKKVAGDQVYEIARELGYSVEAYRRSPLAEGWKFKDLIDHVIATRELQAHQLSQLMDLFPMGAPLHAAIANTAKNLRINKEEKNNLAQLRKQEGNAPLTAFDLSKGASPNKFKAVQSLERFLGVAKGFLAELSVSLHLPGKLLATNIHVSQRLGNELFQDLRRKYPRLDVFHEIDIAFDRYDGVPKEEKPELETWIEIKCIRQALSTRTPSFQEIYERAKKKYDLSSALGEMGHPIRIAYVFLNGGIDDEAKRALKSLNIDVYAGIPHPICSLF